MNCYRPSVNHPGGGRGPADVVMASLTDDHGEEARRLTNFALHARAVVGVCDAPRQAEMTPLREILGAAGFSLYEQVVNASLCGDRTSRVRRVLHAERTEGSEGRLEKLQIFLSHPHHLRKRT